MADKLTLNGRDVYIRGRVMAEPLRWDSYAYDRPRDLPPYTVYYTDTGERATPGEWRTKRDARYWINEHNEMRARA